INKSAHQAGARLKFARIAYGASGSAGASLDMGDAEQAARDFIGDEKLKLTWASPRVLLPKNKIKLLLNLLVIATHAVPRGGTVDVKAEVEGETCHFTIRAQGSHARIPPHAMELIAGEHESGALDAHGVQAYYTGLIARAAAMSVAMAIEGDAVTITAQPAAA
ncbi:MAG: histidine phosphotransferase family protein, partial [Beijerinckiaceae bacterium]